MVRSIMTTRSVQAQLTLIKIKIIEVDRLTEDKRDKLIFAKATPNQTIPIIVVKYGSFGNGADIKANKYRYRYDLPEMKK